MAIPVGVAQDATAGDAVKGSFAATGAAVLGALLKYTPIIPGAHQSLVAGAVGALTIYSGFKLLPIFHAGYEKLKSDFLDLTRKRVSLVEVAMSSSVGTIAALAIWTLNPTAALIVGFGTLLSTAYHFATPGAPAAAGAAAANASLPRDFMTQPRPPFNIAFSGVRIEGCRSIADAFESIMRRLPRENPENILATILISLYENGLATGEPDALIALSQLLNTTVYSAYTYRNVDLPRVLVGVKAEMTRIIQRTQETGRHGEGRRRDRRDRVHAFFR